MTAGVAIPQASRQGVAIGLILTAMLAFSVQDVVVKIVADEVSIWQLQSVRSSAIVLLLVTVTLLAGRLAQLEPTRLGWPLARALFMSAAYLLFYTSLPLMALSEAAAVFFVGPLLITLLAAAVLREPVGPRRAGAVAIGFAGVLLIVRPWSADFQPAAVLPLAAACCYAMGVILTRWRCHDQRPLALTLVHNVVLMVLGLVGLMLIPWLPLGEPAREAAPFVLDSWRPLGALALVLMLSTAATHLCGSLCSIRAYQLAEASRLAPFEYSYLAIVPFFDIAIWGVVPDATALAGMALIATGGGIIARREGRRARPTVLPQGQPPWTATRIAGKKGG